MNEIELSDPVVPVTVGDVVVVDVSDGQVAWSVDYHEERC